MLKIEPYKKEDFSLLVGFVSAIQEHERRTVSELKTGQEIGSDYANILLQKSASKNGIILMARADDETVGFICARVETDEDLLLQDDKREHAYISDIFVVEAWRGKNVAQALLKEVETLMHQQGCKRMRICSKATNMHAVRFYQSSGFKPYEIIFSKVLEE
jgi:ribosomal protein S18 acetylase RimI-like enzyme